MDAAEWGHAWDDYSWAEEMAPVMAVGSSITLCFAAVEKLLDALIAWQESDGCKLFKDFEGGRGAPKVERRRLYLEREVGWTMDWSPSDRRLFEHLQTVRNRWAHSLGGGFSMQLVRELAEAMEWPDQSVRWEDRMVDATLQSVGSLAHVVEAGMLRRAAEQ